jgi:hypothetical protein
MKSATETGSSGMIYMPSFKMTGAGIQAILRCCPSNKRL